MPEENEKPKETTKKTAPQKAVRCPNCNFPDYNGKECKYCGHKA